jgi:HK97 family phage portal protein
LAFRDFIKIPFSSKKRKELYYARMLNGQMPIFSTFGNDVYASDVVQTCIDIIATECSKLMPKHIRTDDNGMQNNVKSSLNRLFKFAPNELMTTKDFIEKTIWLLYKNLNVFIYGTYDVEPSTGKRVYKGLYPLNPTQVTFLKDASDTLFLKMAFGSGEEFTLPYSDIIHLRKKFSENEVLGGGANGQADNAAILKVLEINNTVLQGLDKAVKTSLSVRGIIKIQTMLDDESQQKERERFERAMDNGDSGILPMDIKGDYFDVKTDPKIIDKSTLDFLQNKLLNFYGVSVPIFTGDFTDEQYQAFYEKTLEPIIISLGQAFSKTLLTPTEIFHGNEIVFYPQMLLFTNTKNKIAVADILGNRGALTNNQLLQLFGYPPYEGGDVRNMSLNFIDVALANEYQMKRAEKTRTEGD